MIKIELYLLCDSAFHQPSAQSLQLLSYVTPVLIQVERFQTDSVTAHVEVIIRRNIFLRFCIQQNSGHFARVPFVAILNISEYLIEVAGDEGSAIVA